MKEELQALGELVQEMAKKYDIYITSFSFYGEGFDITAQRREDADTSIFVDMEED